MENDANLCLQLKPSLSQRKTEQARGEGNTGTMNFETTGCYRCNGYDTKCPSYLSENSMDLLLSGELQ